jgi:fatty-acyl-CoA synthase
MSDRALSYWHQVGTTPLIGHPIDVQLREICSRQPDHEAIVSVAQGRRLTYAALDAAVDEVARGLLGLGIARGDRVGIWSTDNVEWTLVQLATARIGAILVTINPANRIAELAHVLRLARVQALITIPGYRASEYLEMVCQLCPEAYECSPQEFHSPQFESLRHLVVFDPDAPDDPLRPARAFRLWSELIAAGESLEDDATATRGATLDADDPINIQFTSGTTGFPKAVVLTHHNILNNAYAVGEIMGLTPDDRLCVPVPFYHCFGMVVSTLACLARGATIVIPSAHFDPGAALATVRDERCTALHGVPTMFIAELDHPDFDPAAVSTLRTGIIGGAPCPPPLLRRIMEDMGCRGILIAYGQTESSPVTHITRVDSTFEQRTETVGMPLPHQESKVVDPDTGCTVPFGETGEVCFRGYHVMRGYFDQDDATRAVVDPAGWLHSGDLGIMDRDGSLRIVGRLKDMIIRGGENIYPAEIEAFYHQHPKVAAVAVFGVPHPTYGEDVWMWAKLRPGEIADEEELREYASDRLAHFKVPGHIRIVDAFPMTATGKIRKQSIREIVANEEGTLACS